MSGDYGGGFHDEPARLASWPASGREPFAFAEFLRALEGVLAAREARIDGAPPGAGFARPSQSYVAVGELLIPPDEAYHLLETRLLPAGFTPLLRRRDNDHIVIASKTGPVRATPSARRALWFFAATVVSVLLTGGAYGASDSLDRLLAGGGGAGGWLGMLAALGSVLLAGVPYAASILGILVAHEAGHFFAARRVGIPSGFPYLIPLPVPLSPFGTLGAVMRINAPPRDRRALLTLAVAGPLAGLVVTIPVLLLGLTLSAVAPFPTSGTWLQEGNSLLYGFLKLLVFGRPLPSATEDVMLHPVAWAGWAGLLVTGLNLLPVGQLDGGHIAYALLGPRARWLAWAMIASVAVLTVLTTQWVLLLVLLLAFGRVYAVPLNDASPIRTREAVLAVAMIVLFAVLFTPDPLSVRGV